MSKKRSWDDIAKKEFKKMPKEYQADWREMRAVVYGE
jgi:DNA-binding ferritin-like protein (Dps family)